MNPVISVENLEHPELVFYAQRSERQLLRAEEPHPGYFLAESPLVISLALRAGYLPVSFLVEEGEEKTILPLAGQYPSVPVYMAKKEVLFGITGFPLTRGALSLMRRRPPLDVRDLCEKTRRIVVLEEVVNPANVGAIFRSAAALGVDAVLLTPGSSDPLYRRALRVSMGNTLLVPWAYLPQKGWQELLHKAGFVTAAMALREDSLALDDPALKEIERLALVMGTEGEGLKAVTIEACDYTVRIPMANGVDSLNVAAASAVAFWELFR